MKLLDPVWLELEEAVRELDIVLGPMPEPEPPPPRKRKPKCNQTLQELYAELDRIRIEIDLALQECDS